MFDTLLKYDLKALKSFVAVVECRGVSAARERLNLSQSVISTHLSYLEDNLGVVLCRRGRSGFELSKEGHRLYEACIEFLQAAVEFQRDVQQIQWNRSVLSGTLRLGLSAHLQPFVAEKLSSAVHLAARKHPQLRWDIAVTEAVNIEAAVADNRMDLGLGSFQVRHKNLHYVALDETRYRLFAHVEHPAAALENPSLLQLNEEFSWVNCSYTPNPGGLLNGGVASVHASHVEAAALLVLSGSYLAYLPEHVAKPWFDKGLLVTLLPAEALFSQPNFALTRPVIDPRTAWLIAQLTSQKLTSHKSTARV